MVGDKDYDNLTKDQIAFIADEYFLRKSKEGRFKQGKPMQTVTTTNIEERLKEAQQRKEEVKRKVQEEQEAKRRTWLIRRYYRLKALVSGLEARLKAKESKK